MKRALVLGGGGVAGVAWETGLLAGLTEAGIDLAAADRFVGTSAGSVVAAQITTGTPLLELFDRQLSPDLATSEIAVDFDIQRMTDELIPLLIGLAPGVEMRQAVGRYALEASTLPEAVRRAVIAARLPSHEWPTADVRIVGVDAETGELRIFTRGDGVDLVDAVAASCAVPGVWPPVTIDGRRYIDGGMRSGANVDLALGCDVVLLIQPMDELPRSAPDVRAGIEELERTARILTVRPDDASRAAMGANPLDPATARPSALAGRAQAAAHLDEVRDLWG